jgi:NTE family protein
MTAQNSQSPRIAVVLGAGGIKCIATIGLLKILHREHIRPDIIVGCSGGSLFGAVYAIGEDPDRIESLVLKMWQKREFRDFKYLDLARMFFPRLLHFNESFGIIKGKRIENIFSHYFQGKTFEMTNIPLQIVATDFFTGESVVLHEGSIAEAVRASISIPIFLQPKKINGRALVDGAVSNPLPVDVAIRYGADVIIAMGFESSIYETFNSPIDMLLHLTALYNNNLMIANHAIHNIVHHYEVNVVFPDIPNDMHFFDTERIPELIELGEQAAEEELPNIKDAIEHFGK